MTLPKYDAEIGPEEAYQQFDFATSRLVLLPRGRENIRAHVFDAATDAALASSRFIGALERAFKTNNHDPDLAKNFAANITTCIGVLGKMDGLYDLFEEVESEKYELARLNRERNIIQSYISLMNLRFAYVREIYQTTSF